MKIPYIYVIYMYIFFIFPYVRILKKHTKIALNPKNSLIFQQNLRAMKGHF